MMAVPAVSLNIILGMAINMENDVPYNNAVFISL